MEHKVPLARLQSPARARRRSAQPPSPAAERQRAGLGHSPAPARMRVRPCSLPPACTRDGAARAPVRAWGVMGTGPGAWELSKRCGKGCNKNAKEKQLKIYN